MNCLTADRRTFSSLYMGFLMPVLWRMWTIFFSSCYCACQFLHASFDFNPDVQSNVCLSCPTQFRALLLALWMSLVLRRRCLSRGILQSMRTAFCVTIRWHFVACIYNIHHCSVYDISNTAVGFHLTSFFGSYSRLRSLRIIGASFNEPDDFPFALPVMSKNWWCNVSLAYYWLSYIY